MYGSLRAEPSAVYGVLWESITMGGDTSIEGDLSSHLCTGVMACSERSGIRSMPYLQQLLVIE